MTFALTVALIVAGPQTFDLRFRPTVGKPIVFSAVEERTEGTTHNSLGTRFLVLPASSNEISLTTGPFSSGGRTFGRPKTNTVKLTPQATLVGDAIGRPPFLMSVGLPKKPIRVGDTWTAVIVGPTPMPAGVKATFKAIGISNVSGAPCLRILGKIDAEASGAKISGTGQWTVRTNDGLVQSGSLDVLLVYRRPDPNTKQMVETARVKARAMIKRS